GQPHHCGPGGSVSTCPVSQDAKLSVTERAYLEGVAHDTWRFFRQCVGAQERHLPPDNLQLTPCMPWWRTTSPTNIGMSLLSVTCARQFGWIEYTRRP
ncbi:MAG: hypothetical protein IPG23_28675, partial [Burkholderiales bacterium]|nr:hypothetical protein [Burkholderiales bacterium]